ncbi:hypothetical protein LXA43DRAFT_849559, partial [Ganoderma leucocontextum]
GPCLPRRDREEELPRYCRLMLALFKPWRSVSDLVSPCSTWRAAFDAFVRTVSAAKQEIMDNMAIFHECRDSRNE